MTLWPGILGSRVSVQVDLPGVLPPLYADRDQLETTLVSLATNARDAMESDAARGVIPVLRLSAASDDGAADSLPSRSYIRIDVSDTGLGMDPSVLEHATEPFFTTKARERGTGLSLAMARGFAEQSGGKLILRSQVGQGTTASLLLPQASVPTMPAADATMASMAASPQRIMLVDDDVEVLETLHEMLAGCGYDVASFDSAMPAVTHLESAWRVDLLITDLSMPGTDGVALIEQAQRRWPGLPAILLTGHGRDALALAMESVTGERLVVLQKPVRIGELLKQVGNLLTESGVPPA